MTVPVPLRVHAIYAVLDEVPLFRASVASIYPYVSGITVITAHDRDILRDLLSLAPPGIDELYALTFLGVAIDERHFECIIVDPAPVTFSTMMGWPSDIRMPSLKIRPSVSVGPPAGNGTIIVMGCEG